MVQSHVSALMISQHGVGIPSLSQPDKTEIGRLPTRSDRLRAPLSRIKSLALAPPRHQENEQYANLMHCRHLRIVRVQLLLLFVSCLSSSKSSPFHPSLAYDTLAHKQLIAACLHPVLSFTGRS